MFQLGPVDLWVDWAVLHFFIEEKDKQAYIDLLKCLVKPNGYVLLAQFSLREAERCSGLPIHRYSPEILQEDLGTDFKLAEYFGYTYNMPSGDHRPFVYALFSRKESSIGV